MGFSAITPSYGDSGMHLNPARKTRLFAAAPARILGLVLLLVLAAAAPAALEARDEGEYGRYLGTRLRMYDEAYKVLDTAISGASGSAQARYKRIKAEVMISQAEFQFQRTGDGAARLRMYEAALREFGDVSDPAAIAAKGELQVQVAREIRRTDPSRARTLAREAHEFLKKERDRIEGLRGLRAEDEAAFRAAYAEFSRIYYQECMALFVVGLTYEMGSEERQNWFRRARMELDEFQFALDDVTEEQVLSFELLAEISLADNRYEDAVGQFMDLVGFVSAFNVNSYVGRLALDHGYLRAAEILTTHLDFDPANLERAVELYAEAFSRFGQFQDLAFQFKRFQLFRVSAQIKIGGEQQIRTAVDQLFQLAQDRDLMFRRQALAVLADVAARPGLNEELRLRCADMVYAERATNPVSVLLQNIAAYRAVLATLDTEQRFEMYGPLCYTRIAQMYSDMWRFLDAALVYREAAYRTGYFVNKFEAAEAVPEHMRDRTEAIHDAESLRNFASEMATQFERHARFLTMPQFGEPNNREYQLLLEEASELRAALGGVAAQRDLAYRRAGEMFNNREWAQAAVRYLNLPASYRSYHIGLYVAAKSYYNLTEDATAPRISRRGADEGLESEEFFREQMERHATDLAILPESMWRGVEVPHWDVILNAETSGQLANWHKAVYFYKKYFLIEAVRYWSDLQPLLADDDGNLPDDLGIADAIVGVAQLVNQRWLRENPTGEGEGDRDLRRMGVAAYDLAHLLRNPPRTLPEAQRTALQEQERELALRILRPYWNMYGPHLEGREAYQQFSLRMAFSALVEDNDWEAAERFYRRYVELYPEDDDQLARMAGQLFSLMSRTLTPRVNAMLRASSRMTSRANELKKFTFARRTSVNPEAHPEVAAALEEAADRDERRQILARHFWEFWIVETIFGGDRGAEVTRELPDLQERLEQRWNELAETYPARWHEAILAEFEAQLARDGNEPIREEAREAVSDAAPGRYAIILEGLRDGYAQTDARRSQLFAQLAVNIGLNTDALAWFTGTVWIYDFAEFLEEQSAEVNRQAEPLTRRVLHYYEESRERRGTGGVRGLSEGDLMNLGRQYSRLQDWARVRQYLTQYIERASGTWGDVTRIPVDQTQRLVGRTSSGDEYESRYLLGRALLELYKAQEEGSRDLELLKEAALQVRRCWSFNLVRDANELGGNRYRLLFQDTMERYYLAVGEAMSEIYLLLHEVGDLEMEWPEYQNQFTTRLDQDRDNPLQMLPSTQAEYLWAAREIHLRIWASFRQLDAYPFRTEFRVHLHRWLELTIRWVNTYGSEHMDVSDVRTRSARVVLQEAWDVSRNEGRSSAAFVNPSTQRFLDRTRELGAELQEAARQAGIEIGR
jgi:hypothetical protein